MIVNAGHPEGQDDLEKVLAATMGEVFPHVLRDPIEDTNTLIVASERPLSARACGRGADLPRTSSHGRAARRGSVRRSGRARLHRRQAPVEWLIDRSIVDYAAGED